MALSIEQLRINYSKFHDVKIRQLAFYEYHELSDDGRRVLIEEVKRRDLETEYGKAIEISEMGHNETDLHHLVQKIHHGSCPNCGRNEYVINGGLSRKISSYGIGVNNNTILKVACHICLNDTLRKNATRSALVGWWSVTGIFRTLHALFTFYKQKKINEMEEPNRHLRYMVAKNYVPLKMYEADIVAFEDILNNHPDSV